ncbi:carbohydrate ABC transporter permease [Cohnella silvisoli]|uniref:Carbohydrate ABC transporter permease n=1 Tax=Cohnella silvisoli TaxID=2873699 RepID=A0ABV1L2N2_9BACL|nr:carbohydrate ABC transporter permease [Cohnella silvisoli]MCD9025852.1 carbohydrate ABC transporter permease [Cohnella silvisoli]
MESKRTISLKLLEIGLLVLAAVFIIPVYYLFVTTFKTSEEALLHPLRVPLNFTLENYTSALESMKYFTALKNNVIISVAGVTIVILFSSMAAYVIARRKRKVYGYIFMFFLTGIMVPYQMGLLPLYKLISSLDLINTLTGVILIEACYSLPLAIFLFRNFIDSVPLELEEAAFIDGCGVFRTYWTITFRLLTPVVATVAILTALATWNNFLTPLLFLHSREKGVLLLELYRNVGEFTIDYARLFPMLFLTILPLMLFYLSMQRFIIEGMTAGSVKG